MGAKLNDNFVLALKAQDKETCYWDEEIKGLGVRLHPSGKKSWVLSYYFHGRKRKMTLGVWPALNSAKARGLAKDALYRVFKGFDPAVPPAPKEPAFAPRSVAQLCDSFLENHSRPHKKSWKIDRHRFEKKIKPALGAMLAHKVTRKDVVQFHNRLGEATPYEANRNLELLRTVFEYARDVERCVPSDFRNPAKGLQFFDEFVREMYVPEEAGVKLVQAIMAVKTVKYRNALLLYLLTGMRNGELMARRREHLNPALQQIYLKESKGTHLRRGKKKKAVHVHLSAWAVELFRQIPEEGSPYFWPGKNPDTHLKHFPKGIWDRIRATVGMPGLHIHDLRHTFGTWLISSGVFLSALSRLLGHSQTEISETYAHVVDQPSRDAVEIMAGKVQGFMQQVPPLIECQSDAERLTEKQIDLLLYLHRQGRSYMHRAARDLGLDTRAIFERVKSLCARGLVEAEIGSADREGRKYYRVTPQGEKVAEYLASVRPPAVLKIVS